MHTLPSTRHALMSVVFALTTAVAAPSFALDPPDPMHGGEIDLLSTHPKHLERRLEHIWRATNATPEQRVQIQKIAQQAAAETQPQLDAVRQERRKRMELLTAAVVDGNAIEALRQQHMVAADALSRRHTQAWVDISLVLSQAQRIALAEHIKKHAHRMRPQDQSLIPAP
jgi:periplasmic protein CpxP/Spy